MISQFVQFISVARSEFRNVGQRALRVFIPLSLCSFLGCAETQLAHHSDALNRASAATMSEHVLLNAVRASLDLPMSFTKLTKYTTENMAKGSLTPKIPFGPSAIISNDVGPAASWSSGVFQVEYVDVNTAGALVNLNKSLPYDAIERYSRDGIPFSVLFLIFVHEVEVHRALAVALDTQFKKVCHSPTEPYEARCNEIQQTARDCGRPLWREDRVFKLEGGHEFHVIQNRARDICVFREFQALFLTLTLSGMASDLRRTTTYERTTTPEQRHLLLPLTATSQALTFRTPAVHRIFIHYEEQLQKMKRRDKAIDRSPIKLALRSPRSALAHLGDLIALQNSPSNPGCPEIVTRSNQKVCLFNVVRGGVDATQAAVSVRGPYGDTYLVPHPDYGSSDRDQTLRVLWMVAEVVNAAISEKDFPAPSTVTVRAIQ